MNGSLYHLGGGRYRVRWRDPDGGGRSRTFDQRADAKVWLAHVRSSTALGELPIKSDLNVREFVEAWWPTKAYSLKPSTRRDYRSIIDIHILPSLGSGTVRRVSPRAVESLLSAIPGPRVKNIRAVLHTLFQDALREGLTDRNPVSAVRLPKTAVSAEKGVTMCPSPSDVWRLIDVAPQWAKAIIGLAGFAGLRWGEIAGLASSDLNLERCEVRVERSFCSASRTLVSPKSKSGTRTALYSQALTPLLDEHLAALSNTEIACPSPKGQRLNNSNFKASAWRPATERLGLVGTRFHDLRHTYASILIAGGVTPPLVARLMGHSSPAVTLNVYAHFWPDLYDGARNVLGTCQPF